MFIATFVIYQAIVAVSASPLHKYPFVFLLDVGNEELEKVNTEQIRLTVPGGSIAVRYPAVGDGDTIGHVRVSGIDFGTDLKANILDGGPGYKYVVLVFMGNAGVTYDAVVTIQTVPDDSINKENKNVDSGDEQSVIGQSNINDDIYVNAKEKVKNTIEKQPHKTKKNAELNESPQPSLIVQKYADNQGNNNDQEANNPNDQDHSQEEEYSEISDRNNNDVDVKDYLEDNNAPDPDQESDDEEAPQPQEYKGNNGIVTDEKYDSDVPISIVDDNLYDKYEALKPHLYNSDVKIYAAGSVDDVKEQYDKDLSPAEEPVDLDQMFNDEVAHNDDKKTGSSSNNKSDGSAVEY